MCLCDLLFKELPLLEKVVLVVLPVIFGLAVAGLAVAAGVATGEHSCKEGHDSF